MVRARLVDAEEGDIGVEHRGVGVQFVVALLCLNLGGEAFCGVSCRF